MAVTLLSFWLAYRFCDGEGTSSDWGVFIVGFINIALFVAAGFVSLLAWLVYFIVN